MKNISRKNLLSALGILFLVAIGYAGCNQSKGSLSGNEAEQVIYDGFVLSLIYYIRDYPIENIVLGISLLNPIDLARIFFILDFNISALMGYTGALFNKFFGSSLGNVLSITMMILWFVFPLLFKLKSFYKKDF